MAVLRTSEWTDAPQLKALWKLAFGDEDGYIDNFFRTAYAPERVLVLEEEGAVRAMTAWFDMPVVCADGTEWSWAYLYAVATHPDFRGRGLAGQLLAFAARWLKEQGFVCLTTVPARPDLHVFFGQNGFEECFVLGHWEYKAQPDTAALPLEPVGAQEYGRLRQQALTGTDHVRCGPVALDYQAGICAMTGGLYRIQPDGCVCVETAGQEVFVKELLADPAQWDGILNAVAERHPARRYWVRSPYTGQEEPVEFGMIRWLGPTPEWHKKTAPYLGLAFD